MLPRHTGPAALLACMQLSLIFSGHKTLLLREVARSVWDVDLQAALQTAHFANSSQVSKSGAATSRCQGMRFWLLLSCPCRKAQLCTPFPFPWGTSAGIKESMHEGCPWILVCVCTKCYDRALSITFQVGMVWSQAPFPVSNELTPAGRCSYVTLSFPSYPSLSSPFLPCPFLPFPCS